jgi:general secretion pathway protein G
MQYSINQSNKKGFTLIELIVVIAIIGLLASVVLTSMDLSKSKAEIAKMLVDYKSVSNSMELYRQAHNGAYPGNPLEPMSVEDLTSELSAYMSQVPSTSKLAVRSGAGNVPDMIYMQNPAGGAYPRYLCGDTNSTQDYVLYFVPTKAAIDSKLFKPLSVQSGPEGAPVEFFDYEYLCVETNQK